MNSEHPALLVTMARAVEALCSDALTARGMRALRSHDAKALAEVALAALMTDAEALAAIRTEPVVVVRAAVDLVRHLVDTGEHVGAVTDDGDELIERALRCLLPKALRLADPDDEDAAEISAHVVDALVREGRLRTNRPDQPDHAQRTLH